MLRSEMTQGVVEQFKNTEGGFTVPSEVVPTKRLGDEKDIAGAFLYLASRAGGYCNGLTLLVDGGRLNVFPSTF